MTFSMHRPTIVLADDHRGVVNVASMLLCGDYDVVATVCDGAMAVEAVAEHKPDIVVLDIGMPSTDGIHAAQRIRTLGFTSRVVFLTVQEDADCVEAARALGASYVLKPRMYSDLVMAIAEALAGRLFFSIPVRTFGFSNPL